MEVGDVDKRSVPTPIAKKDLEKENLQKKINHVTYSVEAAKRLNMENILSVYRKEQGLLIELYQALHGEMPTVVTRMNTTTILTLMRLLAQRNVTDGNTLVIMEEACKCALQENDDDDAESGSNYEPSNAEDSSEDEEEDELSTATAAKTPSSAAKRPSSSTKSDPAKRQKTGKSPDPLKRTEVDEDDEDEESSAKSAPAPNPSKRSHHKTKKCPVEGCAFNGNDLRRHLNVHVKKGHHRRTIGGQVAFNRQGRSCPKSKATEKKGQGNLKWKVQEMVPCSWVRESESMLPVTSATVPITNLRRGQRKSSGLLGWPGDILDWLSLKTP